MALVKNAGSEIGLKPKITDSETVVWCAPAAVAVQWPRTCSLSRLALHSPHTKIRRVLNVFENGQHTGKADDLLVTRSVLHAKSRRPPPVFTPPSV